MTEISNSDAVEMPQDEPQDAKQPPSKKVRLGFSVKHFRKSLQTQEKTSGN